MKITEIRKKSDKDLHKILQELKEDVRSLRFRVASREVKNHQLLGQARKSIARVLTILKEREHGQK